MNRVINYMIENMICMKHLSLLGVILNMLFIRTLILKLSRKLLRIKVIPDLHLTYSKNGGNQELVLKMKIIACVSILLTKHVKYTYLYLFKFVLYSILRSMTYLPSYECFHCS